jgi:dynein heavy chain
MGKRFIEPPVFDLLNMYNTLSAPWTPLIFILSPNVTEPRTQVMELADKLSFGEKKVVIVSLGQGQGAAAKRAIEEAIDIGKWVLLQNCHLAISWLPTLDKIISQIVPERIHQDFRLWLTTTPTDLIPVNIVQEAIKLTNEPPRGIKANLFRTYSGFEPEFITEGKQPKIWKKLLFGLCFFHAVIQGT